MASVQFGQHAPAARVILHLSDTHLVSGDRDLYGDVDSAARLTQIVADIEASGTRPEAIVVTGDVADKGEPGAYARVRAILEPAAERIGAQVIWAMGNHDERGAFRQELFGLQRHPALAGGRVPLTLQLLSPAHRPIQITRDLPGFWRGSWAAVRSEMRGRYPRHPWPEDPAAAAPTMRAKPRGT